MNFPRSVLISLIVMISMGVVAIALVPQRGRDAAILHVPQISEVATLKTGLDITDAVATFDEDSGVTLALFRLPAVACDNLMGKNDGWHEAIIARWDSANGHNSPACWHAYDNYQLAWDGGHYGRSIIALCPLIDGIRRGEGCVNILRDAFQWR